MALIFSMVLFVLSCIIHGVQLFACIHLCSQVNAVGQLSHTVFLKTNGLQMWYATDYFRTSVR